jgi:hypothetical protein
MARLSVCPGQPDGITPTLGKWLNQAPAIGRNLTQQRLTTVERRATSQVLSRRTFTITVRPSGPFQDDGYTVAPHGAITFTFRRGAITQTVASQPAF